MEFVLELVPEFEELEVLALVKEDCVGGNGLGGGGATVLAGAIVTSLGRGAVLIGASLIGFGSFGAVGGRAEESLVLLNQHQDSLVLGDDGLVDAVLAHWHVLEVAGPPLEALARKDDCCGAMSVALADQGSHGAELWGGLVRDDDVDHARGRALARRGGRSGRGGRG